MVEVLSACMGVRMPVQMPFESAAAVGCAPARTLTLEATEVMLEAELSAAVVMEAEMLAAEDRVLSAALEKAVEVAEALEPAEEDMVSPAAETTDAAALKAERTAEFICWDAVLTAPLDEEKAEAQVAAAERRTDMEDAADEHAPSMEAMPGAASIPAEENCPSMAMADCRLLLNSSMDSVRYADTVPAIIMMLHSFCVNHSEHRVGVAARLGQPLK